MSLYGRFAGNYTYNDDSKVTSLQQDTGDGAGYMRTVTNGKVARQDDFTYSSASRDKSYILTGSLYYKHTFAPENTLETTLAYNRNGNSSTSVREENHTLEDDYYDFFKYKNRRSSGCLDVDYSSIRGTMSTVLRPGAVCVTRTIR